MSLRLLYIFQMVVEYGGISAAAKQLYMSQPAVSHAIAQLEDKISVKLFDRIGKRLYLSEGGKQFYQKTCQLLTIYKELEQQAKQLNQMPPLRIGSSITNANILLPDLIRQLQATYQGEITVVVQNAQTIEEKLLRNEVDLAFLEGALAYENLIQIPLTHYENRVFCSSSSPLLHRSITSLSDLIHEDWLLREQGSAIRATFDSTMNLLDQVIQPVWESVNSQVLIEAVKAGIGISILPEQLLQNELARNTIQYLPVKEAVICHNHIVYHKEKHIHEGMAAFLTLCKPYRLV